MRIGARAFGSAEFEQLRRAPEERRPALARELTGQPNLDYRDFRLLLDDLARTRPRSTDRAFSLSEREAARAGVTDGFDRPREYGRFGGGVSLTERPTTRARLQADAVGVMNTQPVQHLTVNGVQLSVQGASPAELETLRTTFSRLPASHLRTLPTIVVADRIAFGSADSGGGFVPQRTIDHFMSRSPGVADDLSRMGWRNEPRLELSRAALARRDVQRSGVSFTALHETAHAVDERYGVTGRLTPDSLGNVTYSSSRNAAAAHAADPRGPLNERFGNAYMEFFGNPARLRRSDPVAWATIERELAQLEAPSAQ